MKAETRVREGLREGQSTKEFEVAVALKKRG